MNGRWPLDAYCVRPTSNDLLLNADESFSRRQRLPSSLVGDRCPYHKRVLQQQVKLLRVVYDCKLICNSRNKAVTEACNCLFQLKRSDHLSRLCYVCSSEFVVERREAHAVEAGSFWGLLVVKCPRNPGLAGYARRLHLPFIPQFRVYREKYSLII
jgi:hypothetical protein